MPPNLPRSPQPPARRSARPFVGAGRIAIKEIFLYTQGTNPLWLGSVGKMTRQNSYGKDLREAQRVDLQNRCSEIKALFQVRKTIVHGRQEWCARPGSQSDSAQPRRKSQAR